MTSIKELNRQVISLSGMSSGLDTDAIVESLLKIDKFKVDRQFKQKTKLEWKSEALREINLQLRKFREKNLSVLSESNVFTSAAYNTYKVNMLTQTSAVSISAGASAAASNITINSITQLAEAASAESTGVFSGSISLDTTLGELSFTNGLVFEGGEISFSINGEIFTFDEDTLLSKVISTVNANKNTGVTMSYSSLKKGFKFTSKTTGLESEIAIVNLKGNAFAAENAAFGISEGTYNGKNAKLTIENIEVERSTNSFTIDGITYTLKNTSATEIDFSVERDIETTFNKITAFIDEYNKLVESLQAKIDEEVYRTYDPLTDEEREMLTEDQAKKWEEKAKSGLLRRDSNIQSLLDQMRMAFYTVVEGTGKSASDIGLNTGSYRDRGKIIIDKDKLRAALENDPAEVERIFISTSESEEPDVKYRESGLITRISNVMLQYTKNATEVTLVSNDRELDNAKDKLERLEDWLAEREDFYYRKFTAMEKSIATMNSQTSWLATQFAAQR